MDQPTVTTHLDTLAGALSMADVSLSDYIVKVKKKYNSQFNPFINDMGMSNSIMQRGPTKTKSYTLEYKKLKLDALVHR